MSERDESASTASCAVTLFFCGDVMTGRGIDQILPFASAPHLYEPYMRSALGYVEIAERATGPIHWPVDFNYIWGDAFAELERVRPHARIVNLETAVTVAEDAWPGKGIHYRMHPSNVGCLTAAKIDCCVLANNHVLDWGYGGLAQTLDTLHAAHIATAGAGPDEGHASAPATLMLPGGQRVLVFGFAAQSAGVSPRWAATRVSAGVNFLPDLSSRTSDAITRQVQAAKRDGDIVIASIHWGGNWGYAISAAERDFAHRLIVSAGVDMVHGHSSHHPRAFEIFRRHLILYGCGDFLNDYEGIAGYEESFRPDLGLMYFPTLDAHTGELMHLMLTPVRICHFRVNLAQQEEGAWLAQMINREGRGLGVRVERQPDNTLVLQ